MAQSHEAGKEDLGLSLLSGGMTISGAAGNDHVGPSLTSGDTCPKMPSLGLVHCEFIRPHQSVAPVV